MEQNSNNVVGNTMKLAESDVELFNKVFQLALHYNDTRLHDEKLGKQIRELRDRHNESSNQKSTPTTQRPANHPENCQNTSCVWCYPPVNALSNVLDEEIREQRSKEMQEAIDRETSIRIGQAGCRGGECE